ncbi:MAG: ribonuclease P protein component 4 [Candidatus Woesearchaeota archaeon]
MRKKFKGTKSQQKKLALNKVNELFKKAKEAFDKKPDLADKYVQKARRTAMKYKVKLPLEFRRSICKKCHKYLIPGKNLRVRTHKGHVVYCCLECKGFLRVGYK